MHLSEFKKRVRSFELRSLQFLETGQDVDMTHLLTTNECGECIACCVNPAISKEQYRDLGMPPTEAKPYGQKCVHCTGKGCGVYDVRPSICRGYQCLWKFGLVDAPPNVTGVAWSFEPNYDTLRGWIVVGQCDSAKAVLDSNEHLIELARFFHINLLGLPVDGVVVRDRVMVNFLTRRHGNRFLVKTCDLNHKHEPIISSHRSRICKFVQTITSESV
jgi:hypothetical protein